MDHPRTPDSLTDVPGIRVGHAQVPGGESGCTVVLGPFRGAVDVRGSATGTRELEVLAPGHLVPEAHAILLTGGSAFGLAAADGVMAWLEEQEMGFVTGVAPVPIVPGAVLFDLAPNRPRPAAREGRGACEAAGSAPVEMGRVGAGSGARVGKLLGPAHSSNGGIGSASLRVGPWRVGALVAVNALGEVTDRDGRIVAGVRDADGWIPAGEALGSDLPNPSPDGTSTEGAFESGNTTLAVVATDAPLGTEDLTRWLRVVSTALARRINPVHTPFDGDVVFGVTTGEDRPEAFPPRDLLALSVAAREALETAIIRGVTG